MIKRYCDKCKKEDNDTKFRFDGLAVEMKEIFHDGGGVQPMMDKREIHLCKECFDKLEI